MPKVQASDRTSVAPVVKWPPLNQRLLESERRLHAVLEATGDAILTVNDQGILESINGAAEQLFGYSANEVIGQDIVMLIPCLDEDSPVQRLESFLREATGDDANRRRTVLARRRDGSRRLVELGGREVHLLDRRLFTVVLHEISGRPKTAESPDGRLTTLVRNLPGAAYRCRPDSRFSLEFISDGCARLCGYKAADLLRGKPNWRDLIHTEDLRTVDSLIRRKLSTKEVYQSIYRIRHRDGEERWVWEQGQGIFDEAGELVAIEGFVSDTTELQYAREKLLQSERLAAMGQMLTGIAHESRNALQRIQASVEMLGVELEESSEAAGDVARIARAQEDLQRLFEELRSYAAPIHLEFAVCHLNEIWQRAWQATLAAHPEHKAQLVAHCPDFDTRCRGDAFRLEQVFRKLFENSFAACAGPLTVTIDVRQCKLQTADSLCISVLDNGPGLSDEQRQRVFEAFYTTKTKGSGLGMAIARRIVDAHSGVLRVGDRGPGAAFELVLNRGEIA